LQHRILKVLLCPTENMKAYKPYHVLLFIAGSLLLLAPLVWFAPADGWNIGGMKVRFLTYDKFMHPPKKIKKDISKIVAQVDTTMVEEPVEDTLVKNPELQGNLGRPSGGKLNLQSATTISFNENGLNQLHALFVKMEAAVGEHKKIHILHYGDSQIEGDRMTAYIRQRMQEQFGGNGPGLIPAVNVYNNISFKQTYSANFQRYTAFGGSALRSKRYGSMVTAGRFSPEYLDSADRESITTVREAWIELESNASAYGRAKKYSTAKLFYTSCYRPCGLKVFQNGQLIHEDSLVQDGKYHALSLSFATTPGKLRYVFTSPVSPNILGFSLEGDVGIQVDNIAMRGSSGTFFGKIDQQLAGKMYQDLNAELIIMQFGGNSVPFFRDSSSVAQYARQFKGQLQTIRRLRPSAMILVIGPSDMSHYESGTYVSYPYLPACVRAMRKATLEVGGGYWDLFGAMGGLNSMPSWVERGLAGNDYIHFSNKGASIASQLFYDAFAAAYAKWKTQ
jgi:lysophospholipase L1-like esterase